MERDLLVERTQAGLQRAKAQGKKLGRPTKTSHEQLQAILQGLERDKSVSEMAKLDKVLRATVLGIRRKTVQENVTVKR